MKKQNITDVLYACRKRNYFLALFSKKFTTDNNEPTSTRILFSNTFFQQQRKIMAPWRDSLETG